jgi:hypothetical protein
MFYNGETIQKGHRSVDGPLATKSRSAEVDLEDFVINDDGGCSGSQRVPVVRQRAPVGEDDDHRDDEAACQKNWCAEIVRLWLLRSIVIR